MQNNYYNIQILELIEECNPIKNETSCGNEGMCCKGKNPREFDLSENENINPNFDGSCSSLGGLCILPPNCDHAKCEKLKKGK